MPRPHVISHTLISFDGRLEGFPAEVARYYELAAQLPHEAILTGSGTMVAAAGDAGVDLAEEDAASPGERFGRGSQQAPTGGRRQPGTSAALRLATRDVDAGPGLNGALLAADLLDELSGLLAPYLVGDGRSFLDGLAGRTAQRLELTSADPQPDGHVWLRYAVEHD